MRFLFRRDYYKTRRPGVKSTKLLTPTMNRLYRPIYAQSSSNPFRPKVHGLMLFSSLRRVQACHRQQHKDSPTSHDEAAITPPSTYKPSQLQFWTHRPTWKRAGINTLRCLIGCTTGDFSAMWLLQTFYPELGMGAIMATSSKQSLDTWLLFALALVLKNI